MDSLINQVAEENGLEVMDKLSELAPGSSTLEAAKSTEKAKETDLDRR